MPSEKLRENPTVWIDPRLNGGLSNPSYGAICHSDDSAVVVGAVRAAPSGVTAQACENRAT
ncbi:hypothetical protein [Neisseria chenwenguii]|uniref:hypothetical protein n=1 Tax=Neisseria chenwenguii TaxID=1853278 RepID=UPI0012FE748E|nr:hypothetical protein [Neisseria chenwenguii]